MTIQTDEGFVAVYSPCNQAELALIKSLLNQQRILYYVNNEMYSALYSLSGIAAHTFTVLVERDRANDARYLLADQLGFNLERPKA